MQDIPITLPDGYDGVSNLAVIELAGTDYACREPLEWEFGHPRPKFSSRTLHLHRLLMTADVFRHLGEMHHKVQHHQGSGRPGVLLVRADLKGALTRENYQFGVRFVTAADGAAFRLDVEALLRDVCPATTSVVVVRPVWGRDVVVRVSEVEGAGDMRYRAWVPKDISGMLEWILRFEFGGVSVPKGTEPEAPPEAAPDRPRRAEKRGFLDRLRRPFSSGRR